MSSPISVDFPPSEILSSVNALLGTKYLAACALVCSLWDHLVTLDDEVSLMWNGSWDLTKVVFFLNRYGIGICLIYVNYMLSGMRPPINETSFVLILCILTMVYSMSVNAYVTLRHYSLWDHRRPAIIALWVALAVTYIPVFILGGISIHIYYEHTFYVAVLDTCLVSVQPDVVKGFWGCMVAFDIFVICLTWANALDRPRRHQHEVLDNMRRDGALSFVALFCMRLLNFLLNVILPPTEIFLAVFVTWAMISITLSRLILRIEAVKKPRVGKINTWVPPLNSFELGRWSNHDY